MRRKFKLDVASKLGTNFEPRAIGSLQSETAPREGVCVADPSSAA